MVITKRQFDILCKRYTLSPTQTEIAGLLLGGKTTNRELADALGKREVAIRRHIKRMMDKMFCRNRSDIILRFWNDSGDLGS